MRTIFLTTLLAFSLYGQRKPGSPLDHLPPHIEQLTHFGERADISPDNRRVAFMGKSFGDAFVVDLKTRAIRCLTCSVRGAAFLRVMHLVSGDYILIGPERYKDVRTSRFAENELWFLSKEPGSKPVRLNRRMSEGTAVSKKALRIAYSETPAQNPTLPKGTSRLFIAEVDPQARKLTGERLVYESKDPSCTLEAQDFYENDAKMTFTCYEPGDRASVMSMDLGTGHLENMSRAPGTYNEPEGVFPDGKHTLVEGDRHCEQYGGPRGSRFVDIYKLKLDGTGKDYRRLTFFNDYEGFKSSNPVVSTDGRFMAFQTARSMDEAGVGYGILLYWFR